MRSKHRELLGLFIAILGALFLLVSNSLLWFGWVEIWPVLPFLVGVFWLRMYTVRKKPRQMFLGMFLALFGIFFFLFSSGILPWASMTTLWPLIRMIVGVSLLAVSGVIHPAHSTLLTGLVFTLFAVVSLLIVTEVIGGRISQPLIRLWPLVLMGAGALIYLRARREGQDRMPPLRVEPSSPPPSRPTQTKTTETLLAKGRTDK